MLLTAKEFEESKNYWLNQLSGELSETRLPRDFPADTQHTAANANIKLNFQHERARKLTGISKNNDLSLYVILLASFKLVLYKYTAQTDIIVSSPIFNKESQEYNKWIALRDFLDSQATFKELLFQVKQTVSGAYKNQHYPIRRVIEQLNIGKQLSLSRVILILENLQDRTFISDIIEDFETDLVWVVNRQEEPTALEATIFYNSHLFKEETIQSLANRYFHILDQVLADVNLKIADVPLISGEEKTQLLYEFSQAHSFYPRDRVIHELFQEQAERTPDNTAVIGPGQMKYRTYMTYISYRELNEKTNQLAGLLRTKGVKPDAIVGIMMERSIEMVIGLLAVSKAGGAYLPIDPVYPGDRLWFMIEDSGLQVLLTQKDFAHDNEKIVKPLSFIDRVLVDEDSIYSSGKRNPEITNHPGDLFYVIYTSGSTGRPKGVLINHGSFVNLVCFHRQVFNEDNRCLMSQAAGVSFDAMAFEIWPCLLSGAGLCIVDNDTRIDPAAMKEWLIKNQITISFQPTMMVERLLREEWPDHGVALRALRAAGDQLLSYPQHAYPFRLYNLYGPTEDTVWTTWAEVPVTKETRTRPVIGKPTGNKIVYIIGPDYQLQPTGVPGELTISGAGLARGYLNNPELTAQKFLTVSSSCNKSYKSYMTYILYKTGDLARWLSDGNLEFLGRVDFQVKIRGFRIEPGEIEHQLLQHPRVREAIVIIKEDNRGDKHLCAYIVSSPEPAETPNAEVLKEYLSHRLPGYMIPSFFVHLEEIPLTPNGKVDRRALPEPLIKTGVEYAPPGNEIETRLVKIWSDVLGRTSIGIDDNFFELGGHSLKATLLVSKIHKEFNIKLPLLKIFNQPTVRQLAGVIRGIEEPGLRYDSIESTEKKEYYPLSSAQKRLKVLQQMDSETTVYNLPVFFTLEGKIDRARLNLVFIKLIRRHESLRTSFHMKDNEPVQKVHDEVEFKVEVERQKTEDRGQKTEERQKTEDRGQTTEEDAATTLSSVICHLSSEFIRPFDLSRAPLLRAGLLIIEKDKHLFMFDMHHIICDGISNQLLVQDFMALYEGKELPPLRIRYKDFSQWQNTEKEKKSIKQQENHWLKEFEDDIPILQLPTDYPRPVFQDYEGCTTGFELDVEETRALKQLASKQEVTMHMVLLAIYTILLSKLSRQEDIVVGSPTAGRRHADLEPVIGMFVNMLALRNYPRGEQSFITFLENLKKKIFEAFENQDYQFEDLVEKLDVRRDTGRNPLFDTVFAMQTIDIPEIVIPGLKLKPYPYENTTAKFDLVLQAVEAGEKLEFTFEYRSKLFKKKTIEKFISYFKQIVYSLKVDKDKRIAHLEILTETEKQQILFNFNPLPAQYPKDRTIHQWFETQVEKKPDAEAVKGPEPGGTGQTCLSYNELNEKSNSLARLLRNKGVIPGSIVAIMVEPSAWMIIAIIGILKAGAAYLPIDPAYPEDRLRYMLEDSGASVLLTNTHNIKNRWFTDLQGARPSGFQSYLTGPSSPIIDFDGLGFPDRSLVNYQKYHRYIGLAMVKNSISLQGTRGCPYNCAYCHKIWPKKHIVRSASNIFEEVRLYYRMGVRRFVIIDDIFNLDKKNSTRFFKLIIEKGLDLQLFFPNGLRGDLLTKEYIDLMVEAGTAGLALALETASPRLQKLIGKNLHLDKLRENMEYFCREYPRVILELFTMHGFPTETEKEAMLTLDFIKNLEWIHFPYIHILKIYPNTGMAKLALENGVPAETIARSANLAYHELPETLPFDKSFTLKYQVDFLNNYFLSRERLLHVLPHQVQALTRDEIARKYDSYLPVEINNFDQLLRFTGIAADELKVDGYLNEDSFSVPGINQKIRDFFPWEEPSKEALRVLLLDLSQYFTAESRMLYDVVEPPLGLMYVLTDLKKQLGQKINGKIAKSRIDFDNYEELKNLLKEFKPDVIGIRTLTFYRDFFHRTVAMIRQWGCNVPIIAGGPYATSDYETILQDRNVNLAVLGEGEKTFNRLIKKIIANAGKLPEEKILKEIPGIAFVPGKTPQANQGTREIILLDALDAHVDSPLPADTGENPGKTSKPGDPAYIIYTSGTTGRPKGAIINHRNVVSLMSNHNGLFDFNSEDVWTMFHSYCFDFSVWEMYGALLYGGKLVLIPRLIARDPQTFLEILKKEEVTVLNQTPKAFYNLAHLEINHPEAQLKLRYVIFGGDTLAPAKLKEWKEKYPAARLINMFGITETTVHVTYKEIQNKDIHSGISNIGKPIPTLNTYVMDPYLNLAPVGVPGELVVQGEGVGIGYLNNPELINQKFLRGGPGGAVFSKRVPPGRRRLYKSGDLVKLLDNGEMEYLGRIDHQVKIRGHRIELGEIQGQLLKHDQIADAVVIEREDRNGDKYLCAYIVFTNAGALEKAPGTAELREYLSRILPDYMIPAYFVNLDKIPLTPNGKLDRGALPGPDHMGPANDGEYEAPRGGLEMALAQTWKQVLGRDLIGINENFFAIGGDSIKCIQMASRMNEAGYKVDIKDIFQNPNIKDLAPLVKKVRRIPPQSPITGNISLTPIQQWFFEGQSGSPSIHHYNQAVMLRGKENDRWDEKSLEIVLQKLQQHHDALRITFQIKEGKPLQINHGPDYPVWLQVVDLRGYQYSKAVNLMTARANEIQATIHLEKGPLMKTALFRLADGDRLLMVIHHLVVDGLSWRILFEDLQTLYRQQQKGESLKLPAKTDSYQAWAEKITLYANSENFLKERPYWEALDTTMVPPIKRDFPAPDEPNLAQDTAEVSFELDEKAAALLLNAVNHAFGTDINDILLTGLGLALKQTFDVHRLLIALEGHGRETIIEDEDIDISRTPGWFTTLYPVLLDMSYENDLARQVKEIKETLRNVPHKGIGYGILKYLTINKNKKIDLSITPQVSFNYLGQFDADIERMSFELAREPVGQLMGDQTRRCFDLDITGMIIEKRLLMSITYNRKHYREKTIETLAHQFQISLAQIISYCAALPHRELTPSDFTYKGLSIETVDQLNSQYDIEDLYLLSPMQEGMLFHALYDNASASYFEQISYTFEGEVDESLIEQSINQLIHRHPTLRTLFLHQGFERPIQIVLKERNAEFYYQDLRDLEEEHKIQTFTREFKERDQQRLFDVSKDTLMRAALFRVDNNRYELTWSLHHIIMDGWCLSIVDNEFSEIYQSLKENRTPRLEPVTPYSRYIRWIETQDSQAAKNFWSRYLQGYEQTAALPKKILTGEYDYTTEHKVLELTAEQMKGLKHLARKYQVTMNTLIRVVWGILLAKYNGRQDVVFGAVVSGRPPDIEGVNMIIGLFINTIPVRIRFDTKTTFVRLIKDVQARAVESEHYHYYPLASIQADHPLKQQLLDHLFTFQNYQKSEDIAQLSGKTRLKKEITGDQLLNLRNTEAFERTNYDFNILVIPGEPLKIIFQFNSNVHENSMVSKLVRQWQDIVDQVTSNETIEINEIKISFDLVAIQPVHLQEDEDKFGF